MAVLGTVCGQIEPELAYLSAQGAFSSRRRRLLHSVVHSFSFSPSPLDIDAPPFSDVVNNPGMIYTHHESREHLWIETRSEHDWAHPGNLEAFNSVDPSRALMIRCCEQPPEAEDVKTIWPTETTVSYFS